LNISLDTLQKARIFLPALQPILHDWSTRSILGRVHEKYKPGTHFPCATTSYITTYATDCSSLTHCILASRKFPLSAQSHHRLEVSISQYATGLRKEAFKTFIQLSDDPSSPGVSFCKVPIAPLTSLLRYAVEPYFLTLSLSLSKIILFHLPRGLDRLFGSYIPRLP
jgi:hypothetical protein